MFGATFFFYRIVYEVVLVGYLLYATDYSAVFLLSMGFPTLSFHCFWFYKWQKGYRAKLASDRGAGDGKLEGSAGAGGAGSSGSSGSGGSGAGSAMDLEAGKGLAGAAAMAAAEEPKIHAPPNTAKVQTLLSAGVVSVSSASAAAAPREGAAETKLVKSPPVRKEKQARD